MAITIGSNSGSLFIQRQLADSTSALSGVYERLASGLRINRASDDAAGLAIAAKLNAERRIAMQAVRNVNDGIAALNIAEAALGELSNITLRQKELAEQAANGTYSLKQRAQINKEAKALTDEFNRIAASTSYNGINLLTGEVSTLQIQAGVGNAGQLTADLTSALGRSVGAGTIQSQASYGIGAGNTPTDVAAGDFNGDGVADVLVANIANATASLLLGNGDGTFQAATTMALGLQPVSVTTADFNRDGSLDFVISGAGGGAKVYLNDGRANFNGLANLSGGISNFDILAADLDSNGILDLAMCDFTGGNVLTYLGKGDGTFAAAVSTTTGSQPFSITAGDFNGDGLVDIVSSDQGSGAASLLLGKGDGTFSSRVVFAQVAAGSTISAGDYNGDGLSDVVTSDGFSLNMFLSKGDNTFSTAQRILTPAQPRGIVSTDLNGDGILDLAWTNGSNNTGSIATGSGDGTFRISATFSVAGYPVNLSTADLNGDGGIDIVTGNSTAQTMTALLSSVRKVTTTPYLDMTTRSGALQALGTIESTRQRVISQMSVLGASQIRLSVAANHLSTYWQECSAAEARITNADLASEAANLARLQILQGAAGAVLAQANQQPQIALKLMR